MKTLALDSWPVMEWILGKEPAATAVERLLEDAAGSAIRLLMSAINAGEVYYFLRKHKSLDVAEIWRDASNTLPVRIEVPSAEDIWNAALLRASFRFLMPTRLPQLWRNSTSVPW